MDYEGTLTIEGVQLTYDLKFKIPVPEFLEMIKKKKDPKEVRQYIDLQVKDPEGKPIELSENIDSLFVGTSVPLAVEIHKTEQGRWNVGRSREGTIEKTPELTELVNSYQPCPK